MITRLCCHAVGIVLICSSWAVAAGPVTFDSLLDEMTDRAALARLPDPAYTCRQASSYDRASVAADKPGWFANNDRSFFIREEKNQGRTEWVMMDAEGPGAIVRWWVTSGKHRGIVRVYLDGATEPTIEARVDRLVGGKLLAGPPLSEESAKGLNLYLPIPYAKHCKVTFDRNFQKSKKKHDLLYYQINYRTYAPGTKVESFSMAGLEAAQAKITKVQKKLLAPRFTLEASKYLEDMPVLKPGTKWEIEIDGPSALYELVVCLDAKDRTQALRSTILAMKFDGEQTVWCPVGDFFGSGVGINPYNGWYRTVGKDGMMTCWWVMPFEKKAKIGLHNLGNQEVKILIVDLRRPWVWNDRSMHFHATWRQQRKIETAYKGKKAFDWNFLTVKGQGVYVGDTLTLLNRAAGWWGEGDEKIYVDGEKFPSHFGTGTEDYYGYAWCTTKFFESPFHAQPRAEGPGNFGNVTNTRVRLLDAIPFDKSFKFDMEVWHWHATQLDYAVATYWYGRPAAKANIGPMPNEAVQPVQYKAVPEIPGFEFVKRPPGKIKLHWTKYIRDDRWLGNDQILWSDAKLGDRLDMGFTVEKKGAYNLVLQLTQSPDYATVQCLVNGKKVGHPIDLFGKKIWPAEKVTLGPIELGQGKHTLSIEIVGANEKATQRYAVGLDWIKLEPAAKPSPDRS